LDEMGVLVGPGRSGKVTIVFTCNSLCRRQVSFGPWQAWVMQEKDGEVVSVVSAQKR
jgi:hypothetical protein